jgi:hypothetical protein
LAPTHLDDFLGAKERRRARGEGDPKEEEELGAAQLRFGPDHLVQHFHVLRADRKPHTHTRTQKEKKKHKQTNKTDEAPIVAYRRLVEAQLGRCS